MKQTDWQQAIQEELQAHMTRGSVWVFARKLKSDGTIERYKARLCADGTKQVEGLDYEKLLHPPCEMKALI
ncbi:hypothetical protein HDU92_000861, partial [Lobulomyces angularis]